MKKCLVLSYKPRPFTWHAKLLSGFKEILSYNWIQFGACSFLREKKIKICEFDSLEHSVFLVFGHLISGYFLAIVIMNEVTVTVMIKIVNEKREKKEDEVDHLEIRIEEKEIRAREETGNYN